MRTTSNQERAKSVDITERTRRVRSEWSASTRLIRRFEAIRQQKRLLQLIEMGAFANHQPNERELTAAS